MDTKSLSSRQVRWAQELSWYYFQINYHQGKANAAADALLRFLKRNQDEEKELQAENGRILHRLQNLLTNASLAGLSFSSFLQSHLHQVLIYRTYVLPQLRHFWNGLRGELASECPYIASISGMRLRLYKLQAKDKQARKLRANQQPGQQGWKDINDVFYYQGLSYVPEIIRMELISRNHDDPLEDYFGIEKTQKLLSRKYYWPMFCRDVEDYVRRSNICLASKTARHKPYGDLQSLPVPTHCWKNLLMDFITGLPILTDWKRDNYDSILVIVDWFIKMVYYEPVKVTINAPGLAKVIIDVVMRHHGFSDSIVTDRKLLFTSKF